MDRPRLKTILFAGVFPVLWILVLASLEVALTLLDYGRDDSLVERIEPGLVTDNPDHIRRFFPWSEGADRSQRSNLFPELKHPRNYRVFVVGGSTAQGFPYQRNHSFTAIAQAALRSLGMDVDVVNFGNSAMSSYYVREVLRELVALEPDLVVVYAGHNEYYGTITAFTGGSHPLRLALLRMKEFRTVQLLEDLISTARRRPDGGVGTTPMEQRFAEAAFPPDEVRDARVADLFVRNLSAGLRPLIARGVPALVFEPVSNLVSMPPFRSEPPSGQEIDRASNGSLGRPSAAELYRIETRSRIGGEWDRSRWEGIKDLDSAPFRARSILVRRARDYVEAQPTVRWIHTADELETRAGNTAFTDDYFIDHLHFNFEGQVVLAWILAEAMLEQFYLGTPDRRAHLASYFGDADRIRQDIHLTDFWEFEAYSRIHNLMRREPFLSMPIAKQPPRIPSRVLANSLFGTRDFLDSLEGASAQDFFFLALDRYRALGDKSQWISNMNAYVHLFPGHYESHLLYGLALLADDPATHLEPAGIYFRRAYFLSRRDPEVVEVIRSELFSRGMAASWDSYRRRYLQ
jgi:lysophospholipase L1-like esterase